MAKATVVKKHNGGTIAQNKRARHDYFIEEKFEAGMSLQGWEVKSLRAGRMTLTESYVIFKNGEAFLLGSQIQPLLSASTMLFLKQQLLVSYCSLTRQLEHLMGAVNQKGYSCVPLACYWKGHLVKLEIALVKGKQLHDKRATEKDRDWQRDKARIFHK
ncbi:SsrA-binding protein SmpB [Acinetobacter seifertii]|nr:SsrA-binding protein SmpB [Acinetobacter seifertii]